MPSNLCGEGGGPTNRGGGGGAWQQEEERLGPANPRQPGRRTRGPANGSGKGRGAQKKSFLTHARVPAKRAERGTAQPNGVLGRSTLQKYTTLLLPLEQEGRNHCSSSKALPPAAPRSSNAQHTVKHIAPVTARSSNITAQAAQDFGPLGLAAQALKHCPRCSEEFEIPARQNKSQFPMPRVRNHCARCSELQLKQAGWLAGWLAVWLAGALACYLATLLTCWLARFLALDLATLLACWLTCWIDCVSFGHTDRFLGDTSLLWAAPCTTAQAS